MDRKQTNRQISTGTVSFAPQGRSGSLKRDADRKDSIAGSTLRDATTLLIQPSRETVGSNAENGQEYDCRFQMKWRVLSYMQIAFGLLLFFVDLYSHFPLFSCGWVLSAGADWMWFGTWIGIMNFSCGIAGCLARVHDFSPSTHKLLRRSYFLLNCSFVPFANGIGLTSYGITLSAVPLICNKDPALMFTAVTAFISVIILIICVFLNVLGVSYQVCATVKCKCHICEPKNLTVRGYART